MSPLRSVLSGSPVQAGDAAQTGGTRTLRHSRGCVSFQLPGLLTLSQGEEIILKTKQTVRNCSERLLNVIIKALLWFKQSRSEERRQDCVCAKN